MRIKLEHPSVLDELQIEHHIAVYLYPKGTRRKGVIITTNKPLRLLRRYKAYFDYAREHRDTATTEWGVTRFKVNFDNCPLSLTDIALHARLFFIKNRWPKISVVVIHSQPKCYNIKERGLLLKQIYELQSSVRPLRFFNYSKEL